MTRHDGWPAAESVTGQPTAVRGDPAVKPPMAIASAPSLRRLPGVWTNVSRMGYPPLLQPVAQAAPKRWRRASARRRRCSVDAPLEAPRRVETMRCKHTWWAYSAAMAVRLPHLRCRRRRQRVCCGVQHWGRFLFWYSSVWLSSRWLTRRAGCLSGTCRTRCAGRSAAASTAG